MSAPVAPAAAQPLPGDPLTAPAITAAPHRVMRETAATWAGATEAHAAAHAPTGVAGAATSTAAVMGAHAAASELGDRWCALVQSLIERAAVTALVRELAWSSALVAIDEAAAPAAWSLIVEREALRQKGLADKLTAALAALLGSPLQLTLLPGTPDDSPARRDAALRARRQAEAEATIRSDPVVRELLAQFKGARIVPGSVKPI